MRIALVGFALLAACGTQRRGAPIAGPLALDAEEQRGRIVFMKHCQGCHPGGEAGLGPALNNAPPPVWLSRHQVRLGAGAMPRFDRTQISGEEADALAGFLRASKHHRPERDEVEPVTGSSAAASDAR